MREVKDITANRKARADEAERLATRARNEFGLGACPAATLDALKNLFRELRPFVPAPLALFLAHQQRLAPQQRLFTDPELDLAVWAHARACGTGADQSRPQVEGQAFESELPESLRPYANSLGPLLPTALAWGPTDHLQKDKVLAAVDSPVIHAWLFQNAKKAVTEAVIVGRGIPEVRAAVTAAALSCFFALDPKVDDFALSGLIRLVVREGDTDESPGAAPPGFIKRLLLSFSGASKTEVTIPETASEAMALLQGALQRMQKETGFVHVHLLPAATLRLYRRSLAEHNRLASQSDVAYLWQADASAAADDSELVTTVTYDRFPRLQGVLRLELKDDLLGRQAYGELAGKYHESLVAEILEDTERRERFYAQMLQDHTQARDWFARLSEKEKREVPDVWVDHHIDWETGMLDRLAEPHRVSAQSYYTESMEHKIKEDDKWLQMMRRLRGRINYILKHEVAPLERMVAARLFDAALRDASPSDDPEVLKLFEGWKRMVQPMLWLEWRHALRGEGVSPEDVCTRHTVFNLILNKPGGSYTLIPHSILDVRRSAVLLDRERVVQVVYDPTDHARQLAGGPDPSAADGLYLEARRLAEQGADPEQVREKIWAAVRAAPKEVIQRIVGEWAKAGPPPDATFDKIRDQAFRKEFPTRAALVALRWMNELCVHSADDVLKRAEKITEAAGRPNAAVLLVRACLDCLLKTGDAHKTLALLLDNRMVPGAESVAPVIMEANRLNPKLVHHFLTTGVLAPSSFAQPETSALTDEEEGAVALLAAVEAANLAVRLAESLDALDPALETRRSAFAKLMPAIEACYALEFATPPAGVDEVVDLLVGERRARP